MKPEEILKALAEIYCRQKGYEVTVQIVKKDKAC